MWSPPLAWTRSVALLLLLAASVACGDDEATSTAAPEPEQEAPDFVQPGADDPTARVAQRAGTSWYPGTVAALDSRIQGLLDAAGAPAPAPARAVLVPHAGLKYSGHVQAAAYARVEAPDLVIVLASDHALQGEPLAIWDEGPWLVPGVALETRHDVVASLRERFPDLTPDRVPFDNHPPEMQMPFIAHLNPEAGLVVIAFHDNSRNDFKDFPPERIRALGAALAEVIQEREDAGERVLIAATTDLIHYEPLPDVQRQDAALLGHILALDVEGLHTYVTDESTTICGELPTAVMMATVSALGATADDIEEVAHDTSASINGDEDSAVSYTGVVVWK